MLRIFKLQQLKLGRNESSVFDYENVLNTFNIAYIKANKVLFLE